MAVGHSCPSALFMINFESKTKQPHEKVYKNSGIRQAEARTKIRLEVNSFVE